MIKWGELFHVLTFGIFSAPPSNSFRFNRPSCECGGGLDIDIPQHIATCVKCQKRYRLVSSTGRDR